MGIPSCPKVSKTQKSDSWHLSSPRRYRALNEGFRRDKEGQDLGGGEGEGEGGTADGLPVTWYRPPCPVWAMGWVVEPFTGLGHQRGSFGGDEGTDTVAPHPAAVPLIPYKYLRSRSGPGSRSGRVPHF